MALTTGMQAKAAGALQQGAAASARDIAAAADVVQTAAGEQAWQAARTAVDTVQARAAGNADAELTPDRALARVAGAKQAAVAADDAYQLAVTVNELASHAADSAAALELDLVATAVAARDLVSEVTSRPDFPHRTACPPDPNA